MFIKLRLLVMIILVSFSTLLLSARSAQAAGVVGTGTPASCTETALRSALAGGGLVTFNCGGSATIHITQRIEITSNTTIDGGTNITLRGGSDGLLFVHSPTAGGVRLEIRNITLWAGNAPSHTDSQITRRGGCLYNNRGTVLLDRVVILLCRAEISGAGIYNFQGQISLTGGSFFANEASNIGGGLASYGGTVTISGTSFDFNRGYNGSAISLSNSAVLTADRAIFRRNRESAVQVVSGSEARFTNSTFENNIGYRPGGGAIQALDSRVRVETSTFSSNRATDGGGIYSQNSTLAVLQSHFLNNTASVNGGGIRIVLREGSESSVSETRFESNTASSGAGMYISSYGRMVITDNTRFIGNNATFAGGALVTSTYGSGQITVSNSRFIGNTAALTGGGIQHYQGALSLINLTMTRNRQTEAGRGSGGHVNISRAGNLTVREGQYNFGQAHSGGAFSLDGSGTFTDFTATWNRAVAGGFLNTFGSADVTVTRGLLGANRATQFGGVVSNQGRVVIRESDILLNSADDCGGVFHSVNYLDVGTSMIFWNGAPRGTVICVRNTGGGTTTTALVYSTLDRNTARDGAILQAANSGNFTMINNTIARNRFTTAAVHVANMASNFHHITFADNHRTSGGGFTLMADEGGRINLTRSILYNVAATDQHCSGAVSGSQNVVFPSSGCDPLMVRSNRDPELFLPPADNGGATTTILISPLSPALNLVTCEPSIIIDQRGVPRPQGSACEAGSVEMPLVMRALMEFFTLVQERIDEQIEGAPTPELFLLPTATPIPTRIPPTSTPTATATPVPFVNYTADSMVINFAQCTTLRWQTGNIDSVYFEGQGTVGEGSQQVCPPQTDNFDLLVIFRDGTQQIFTITIQVIPPTNTPAPVCGDSICDLSEIQNCQCTECSSDPTWISLCVPTSTPAPVCGDNICDPSEIQNCQCTECSSDPTWIVVCQPPP